MSKGTPLPAAEFLNVKIIAKESAYNTIPSRAAIDNTLQFPTYAESRPGVVIDWNLMSFELV